MGPCLKIKQQNLCLDEAHPSKAYDPKYFVPVMETWQAGCPSSERVSSIPQYLEAWMVLPSVLAKNAFLLVSGLKFPPDARRPAFPLPWEAVSFETWLRGHSSFGILGSSGQRVLSSDLA